MILAAALVAVAAQSCAALLPPPDLQIEWSRNGQPYARDVPVRAAGSERVYRRSYTNGSPDVTRVLSCAAEGGGPMLRDQVGSGTNVMIPVQLGRSRVVTVNGATVRRIDPPDDAGEGGTWFSISRYGPQLFGIRDRIGIEEIRTPTVSGRVEILRAVLAAIERPPPPPSRDEEERVARINAQLTRQSLDIRDLRDSLALQQLASEQQRRLWADSLVVMEQSYRALWTPYASRAARMLADSAARLPSENEARLAAWFWPGAGHPHMNRSGALWATAGTLAFGIAIAGLAVPDATLVDAGLEPDQVRTAAIAGGSASYLLLMLLSRASLNGAIRSARAEYATRESFLQAATVDLTPNGALVVTVRKDVR